MWMMRGVHAALIILAEASLSAVRADCGCGGTNRQNSFISASHGGSEIESDEGQCSAEKRSHCSFEDTVLVPSGEYQIGTDDIVIAADHEGPARFVNLPGFFIDKYEVSNKKFSEFVTATAYVTEAESFGDSFVFALQLNESFRESLSEFRAAAAPWWYKVKGVNWRHPDGPDSNLEGRWSHPVVHVSWGDANAYCAWRGQRLPHEAEWEAACRAGKRGSVYPWGDQLYPQRKHMANIWQGTFPTVNSAKDGFVTTCPVELFPQNTLSLHNMVGNVWEWVQNSWAEDNSEEKVKKGGSFLCHRSYCFRYRCSARAHNTRDSSAANLGFRCANDQS